MKATFFIKIPLFPLESGKIIALIRENSRSNFKNMQIVDSINTA